MHTIKKVFLAGGGTGGHYYPAISVAQELKGRGFKLYFTGAKRGIEGKRGFPYGEEILFDIKGVRGKNFSEKIKSGYELFRTVFHIKKILKKEKPDLIICFGGYTSFPLGIAAALEGLPLYIHEQNSIPSYTNKLLSIFARKVFVSFEYSQKFFPKEKTLLTGYPLRKDLLERKHLSVEEARRELNIPTDKEIILAFGGSQGAKKITETVLELAKQEKEKIFILITGKNSQVKNPPENIIVYEYFEDMGILYKASDYVISRAGAGTVSEVLYFGKRTIFIPYPYAVSDHQFYNVKWLEKKGISKIIREEDLSLENLKNALFSLKKVKEEEVQKYSTPDATQKIVETILQEI